MATLQLLGFSGEIPKMLPRLLPDMSAQRAFNVRLDDGALTPVRHAKRVYDFPAGAGLGYRTIYRHDDEWLGWAGVVNAAPGPVAQDRLYYTGDGPPKMRVNGTVYPLALRFPETALTATVGGTGEGDSQTLVYAYTYVTEFGEESEPSPLSEEVLWEPGQEVTLTGFETGPNDRGITHQRIYRSQSGHSSGAGLFLIAEREVSSDSFVDEVDPEAIQEPLPSATYNAPPDDLAGLISLPNGMMAAFSGKVLYFSEPWMPHAWPEGYTLTTDYEIVGLGAFGGSIAVITAGNPYIVAGTHPSNMVMEKLELNLPCINPRSIQDLGYSVAYASQDGLVVISPNGTTVVTSDTMTRDNWLTMNPATMTTGQYQGRYLASYRYVDAKDREQEGTIIVDLSGQQPFIIRSSIRAAAFHYDIPESKLYFLRESTVFEWDARGETNQIMSWRSKKFVMPKPTNFGAILIESDDGLTEEEIEAIEEAQREVVARNRQKILDGLSGGALGAAAMNVYPVNGDDLELPPTLTQFAAVAIYADSRLVSVVNGINDMRRLPSGFLARVWEIEVSGDRRIQQIALATTGAELMVV